MPLWVQFTLFFSLSRSLSLSPSLPLLSSCIASFFLSSLSSPSLPSPPLSFFFLPLSSLFPSTLLPPSLSSHLLPSPLPLLCLLHPRPVAAHGLPGPSVKPGLAFKMLIPVFRFREPQRLQPRLGGSSKAASHSMNLPPLCPFPLSHTHTHHTHTHTHMCTYTIYPLFLFL